MTDQLVLPLDEAEYYGMARCVPVTAHSPAGSHQLADNACAALADGPAVLLESHGAVTVGRDLAAAQRVAESFEHQTHVAWVLRDTPIRQSTTRRAAAAGAQRTA